MNLHNQHKRGMTAFFRSSLFMVSLIIIFSLTERLFPACQYCSACLWLTSALIDLRHPTAMVRTYCCTKDCGTLWSIKIVTTDCTSLCAAVWSPPKNHIKRDTSRLYWKRQVIIFFYLVLGMDVWDVQAVLVFLIYLKS